MKIKFAISLALILFATIAHAQKSVRELGAIGNGVADDSAAIQRAINQAQISGGTVYLPSGTYKITNALKITGAVRLAGDGYRTIIAPAADIDGIDINTAQPVIIERLYIKYASQAKSGTAGIYINGPSPQGNTSSVFRDLQILNAFDGMNFIAGTAWVVDNAKIEDFGNVGIQVANDKNNDAGDNTIVNSYIQDANYTHIGIYYVSSSALRVVNNKLLNCKYGVLYSLPEGSVQGMSIFTNNSFDGMTEAAISINRQGSSGTTGRVVIGNNIFNLAARGVLIPQDPKGQWLSDVSIVGNIYYDFGKPENVFATINSTNNFVIANNVLHSTTNTTSAFVVSESATNGVIGVNAKTGKWAPDKITSKTTAIVALTGGPK